MPKLLILQVFFVLFSSSMSAQNSYLRDLIESGLLSDSDVGDITSSDIIGKTKAIDFLIEKEYSSLGLSPRGLNYLVFKNINDSTTNVEIILEGLNGYLSKIYDSGLIDAYEKEQLGKEISNFRFSSKLQVLTRVKEIQIYRESIFKIIKDIETRQDELLGIIDFVYINELRKMVNPDEYYQALKIIKNSYIIDLDDFKQSDDYILDLYELLISNIKDLKIENFSYEIVSQNTKYKYFELVTTINIGLDSFMYNSWIKRSVDIKDGEYFGMIGFDFYKPINYYLSSMNSDKKIYKLEFEENYNHKADYRNIAYVSLNMLEAEKVQELPMVKLSSENDTDILSKNRIYSFLEELDSISVIEIDSLNLSVDNIFELFLYNKRQIVDYIPMLTTNGYGENSGYSDVYLQFTENLFKLKNIDVDIYDVVVSSRGYNKGEIQFKINGEAMIVEYNGIGDWFDHKLVDRINYTLSKSGSRGSFYGINTMTNMGSYIFLTKDQLHFFVSNNFFGI